MNRCSMIEYHIKYEHTHVPVILVNKKNSNILNYVVSKKSLINTLKFLIIRKYYLNEHNTINIYAQNDVMHPLLILNDVYAKYKAVDNILYLHYDIEKIFG